MRNPVQLFLACWPSSAGCSTNYLWSHMYIHVYIVHFINYMNMCAPACTGTMCIYIYNVHVDVQPLLTTCFCISLACGLYVLLYNAKTMGRG